MLYLILVQLNSAKAFNEQCRNQWF